MISRIQRRFGLAVAFLFLAAIAGCRSQHVQIALENRTGAPVQLLEVDYPSASFGADNLAAGATFSYRVQVRGTGPLKVQYKGALGTQREITGPELSEGDEGRLQIVLLPDGKAEFSPQLSRRH